MTARSAHIHVSVGTRPTAPDSHKLGMRLAHQKTKVEQGILFQHALGHKKNADLLKITGFSKTFNGFSRRFGDHGLRLGRMRRGILQQLNGRGSPRADGGDLGRRGGWPAPHRNGHGQRR